MAELNIRRSGNYSLPTENALKGQMAKRCEELGTVIYPASPRTKPSREDAAGFWQTSCCII
jgi:hypothetical protein